MMSFLHAGATHCHARHEEHSAKHGLQDHVAVYVGGGKLNLNIRLMLETYQLS